MTQYNYSFGDHRNLTLSEEYQLFDLYNNTNTSKKMKLKIRDTIIQHNLKFAAKCAALYVAKNPQVQLSDLKSYAIEGLIEAIDGFHHTRGLKFISYAVFWIKNSINRNVQSNESLVRYPANVHLKFERTIKKSISNNEEVPEHISIAYENMRGAKSLDHPIGDNEKTTYSNFIADSNAVDNDSAYDLNKLNHQLLEAIDDLDEDQKAVIKEAFGFFTGDKKTVREIASNSECSEDKIRNIRQKGINNLKKRFRNKPMTYLEMYE